MGNNYHKVRQLILILLCLFFFSLACKSQNSIEVCKWKYGFDAAINFSFDDPSVSHLKISQIFDQYSYKATFFLNFISDTTLLKNYSDILTRGHEIGSHSLLHKNLTLIEENDAIFEIEKGKEFIQKSFQVNCFSYAAPFHAMDKFTLGIANSNHFFIRDNTFYTINNHFRADLNSLVTFENIKDKIDLAFNRKGFCLIAGHGIDGDGYSPIESELLSSILGYIKNKYNYWISTFQDISLYEKLRNEVGYEEKISGDTITLKFKPLGLFFDNFDSLMISIKMPEYNIYYCLENNIYKINDVYTFDLKKISEISFICDSLNTSLTSKNVLAGQSLKYIIDYSHIYLDDSCTTVKTTFNPAKFKYLPNDQIYFLNGDTIIFSDCNRYKYALEFQSIDSSFQSFFQSSIENDGYFLKSQPVSLSVNFNIHDIDKDLILSEKDISLFLKQLTNNTTNSQNDSKVNDLNEDGIINAYDGISILKAFNPHYFIDSIDFDKENVSVFRTGDTLNITTKTKLYSFDVKISQNECLGQPEFLEKPEYCEINNNENKIALIFVKPFNNGTFLKFPIKYEIEKKITFSGYTNNKKFHLIYDQIPLKISSPQNNKELTIYPNPASEKFNIKLKKNSYLTIRNIYGHIIFEKYCNEGNNEVDVISFLSGLYFVEIKQKENTRIIKLIKE